MTAYNLYQPKPSSSGHTSTHFDGTNQQFRSLFLQREDMYIPELRRQTFTFWPADAPPLLLINDLVNAGFLYTGDKDIVKCYSCEKLFSGWRNGMDPMQVHRKSSPHCLHVISMSGDVASLSDAFVSPSAQSYDDVDSARDVDNKHIFSNTNTVTAKLSNKNTASSAVSNSNTASSRLSNMNTSLFGTSNKITSSEIDNDGESDGETSSDDDELHSDSVLNNVGSRKNNESAVWSRHTNAKDKRTLIEENRRLRAMITCRKCEREKSQTLFLPCRHLVTCEACAETMDECIICQQTILGTVKTFLS